MILKSKAGDWYRLEWDREDDADPKPRDRRRALPAGEYSLVTYRIIRRDAKNVPWFISGTAPEIRKVKVTAGEELALKIEERVRVVCSANARDEKVQVRATVSGADGCGLTIYRDGKRIPIGFRIDDASGAGLAEGKLAYG